MPSWRTIETVTLVLPPAESDGTATAMRWARSGARAIADVDAWSRTTFEATATTVVAVLPPAEAVTVILRGVLSPAVLSVPSPDRCTVTPCVMQPPRWR